MNWCLLHFVQIQLKLLKWHSLKSTTAFNNSSHFISWTWFHNTSIHQHNTEIQRKEMQLKPELADALDNITKRNEERWKPELLHFQRPFDDNDQLRQLFPASFLISGKMSSIPNCCVTEFYSYGFNCNFF